MTYLVPRKAKSLQPDGSMDERWLEEWRSEHAYILLGDPGSGKTECLKAEAKAVGKKPIPATLIQEGLAEPTLPDDIVFIDAVDEARGASTQGGNVIGAIGRYLRDNGYPRFRIACREADWRGAADQQLIDSASPEAKPRVLHLSPLSDQDIRSIYQHQPDSPLGIEDFLQNARRNGVDELLRNPLLLDLMIKAVAGLGSWPVTRTALYQTACLKLAEEHSAVHRLSKAMQPGVIEAILDDAGTLCAILLLSGYGAISLSGQPGQQAISVHSLPNELALHDVDTAVKSKVFTIEGDLVRPRHRTIAEYLAARALSKRVQEGLPLSRILSLAQGHDGVPIDSMRGLCAWLTVHLPSDERLRMLQLDPVGFIVNGDAAALTHVERIQIIRALADSADKNAWFRGGAWVDHPFGPLATPDMADIYRQELEQPERSRSRQAFIDCLLDALKHAPEPMLALCDSLVKWVEDAATFDELRTAAYDAWLRHCPPEQQGTQLLTWLHAIEDATIEDRDGRLLEKMLRDAYPDVIQTEVLNFLPTSKARIALIDFSIFWTRDFIQKTPPELLPIMGNAWVKKFPQGVSDGVAENDGGTIASMLLWALLESQGDAASTEQLYQWLGIGLETYSEPYSNNKSAQAVTAWLQARPEAMKAIAALGYQLQEPDKHKYRPFRLAEARLHNAIKPTDWIFWNMDLASTSDDQDFVRWVVYRAANAVVSPPHGLEAPSADDVYLWVVRLTKKHPHAEQWLADAWTTPLTDWRAESSQRFIRYRAERENATAKRREIYAPYLNAWPEQALPVDMLHQIAKAYNKRFYDIDGETPEERVANLLGADGDAVTKALLALDQTLSRDDLPNIESILERESKGKEHYLKAVALLAAERACERDSNVWRTWAAPLQQRLTAFWLTYGVMEEPLWFAALCAEKPAIVAPIMIDYAKGKLRRKGIQAITCLSSLHRDAAKSQLATMVLSELLETFPTRAHEEARSTLNSNLLSALHMLPRQQALDIIERKLQLKTLDTGQRIAWLVAKLAYEPSAATALTALVGSHQRRVTILGEAIHDQGVLERLTAAMPAHCAEQLIAMLAPLTPYDPDWSGGIVTGTRRREDTVKDLLRNLGNNPSPEAGQSLQNLLSMPSLQGWQRMIEFQIQAQQQLFREASFAPASPEKVVQLLCNGAPANIKDLQMLVVEHLRQIEAELRGDPAFQLRHFWADDGTPRTENECRDEMLALLRPRLERHKIDLQPESMAADAKRMDMRATVFQDSAKRLSLPIEAKKENHKDVWIAWRTQLQALYATDPAAQGLGIYLVLWFGINPKGSPEGLPKPTSATDFEESITVRIPERDRSKLKVMALDLSRPPPTARK